MELEIYDQTLKLLKQAREEVKKAFQPMPPDMPQQPMPQQMPPTDPAMMGGGGGMMPPGAAPMPMDPAMMGGGGQPPMDPAMAGGMVPPEGGNPEQDFGQVIDQIMTALEELVQFQQQMAQEFTQQIADIEQRLSAMDAILEPIIESLQNPAPMDGSIVG